MGNSATHLPYPVTSKYLQRRSAHTNRVRIGSSEMQGFRLQMEDSLDIKLPKPKKDSEEEKPQNRLSFFGVFDGHGGEKASSYAAERLHNILFDLPDPKKPANIMQAVLKVDEEFLAKRSDRKQGTTAVFAIVEPLSEAEQKKKKNEGGFKVIVGNLGDSRALLVRSTGRFLPLTKDHKPDNFLEKQRIEAAGGSVSFHRVDGDLAVSRAIGDWTFKNATERKVDEQKVIAVPEVSVAIARPGDSLLLCCDGLFERLTSKQVAGFIYREVTQEKQLEYLDPADIAARLLELSLRCGSGDNMSAILVCFMPDQASTTPTPGPSPTLGLLGGEAGAETLEVRKGEEEKDRSTEGTGGTSTEGTTEAADSKDLTDATGGTSGTSGTLGTSGTSGTLGTSGTSGSLGTSTSDSSGASGKGAGGLEAEEAAGTTAAAAAKKRPWDTLPTNEFISGLIPPKANRHYMQAYKTDERRWKQRLASATTVT